LLELLLETVQRRWGPEILKILRSQENRFDGVKAEAGDRLDGGLDIRARGVTVKTPTATAGLGLLLGAGSTQAGQFRSGQSGQE
jgi:hypothetical protein